MEDIEQLLVMLKKEAKAVRRRSTIVVQLVAQLEEKLATENDSPKEGTRNGNRNSST